MSKVTIDNIALRVPRYPKQFMDIVPQSSFIPCNLTRNKQFKQIYGIPDTPDHIYFKQSAKALLAQAVQVLNALNVKFWLSSGTCLGKENDNYYKIISLC